MLHVKSLGLRRFVFVTAALVAVVVALFAFSASAMAQTVYDSIPNPVPANVPSQPFQAQQTAEFGDQVKFVTGTSRQLKSVTVLMSNWACENWATGNPCLTPPGTTFSHPITLNLYNPGNGTSVGSLITTKTALFTIPFRPSASPVECATGVTATSDGTQWWDAATSTCNNGLATKITFDFSDGAPIILPDEVIFGIAYNTQTYGAEPIGVNGPYNSLNVGVQKPTAIVGTDVDPDKVFWNTATASYYSDGGAAGVGIFRFDTNWTDYPVNVAFEMMEPACTTACYVSAATGNDNFAGTVGQPKKTIQAAIDAVVVGGTVHVASGTYVEQLSISKNLTLQGAGVGTVVKSPAASSRLTTLIYGKNRSPVVLAQNADVVIKDLVVDGDSQGGGDSTKPFLGVAYYNAGGTVQNLEIKNVQDNPFSGSQHGVALYAMVDDGSTKTLDVKGTLIYDFQKNGTAFYSAGTSTFTVNMQDSIVTGKGGTDVTAQNGIQYWQIGGTLKGTVSGNTVSGIAYTGAGWIATSILSYFADLDIDGNTITGAHMGIYSIDAPVRITDNVLHISKSSGTNTYAYGIIASDPPKAIPSPMVEDSASGANAASAFTAASGTPLAIEVSRNTVSLTGGPVTNSSGIEFDAGYPVTDMAGTGMQGIAAVARNNLVSGFDYGLSFFQCTTDCGGGVFASAIAHENSLADNGVAMYSNATVQVNGELNWWGSADGPSPIVAASVGGVTGDVDFEPWLTDGTDTSGDPGFQPVARLYADDATVKFNTGGPYLFDVPVMLSAANAVYSLGIDVNFPTCVTLGDVDGAPAGFAAFKETSGSGTAGIAVASDGSALAALPASAVAMLHFDATACATDTSAVVSFGPRLQCGAADGISHVACSSTPGTVTLDFNSNPTFTPVAFSVNEMVAAGSSIGSFTGSDPDGDTAFTFSLDGGADAAAFTLTPAGALSINASPDYEVKPSYTFNVKVADNRGGFSSQTVTVTVNDVNLAATAVALSPLDFTLAQATAGSPLGTFSFTDGEAPFGPYVCSITSQTPADALVINPATPTALHVGAADLTAQSYSVTVDCTDDGLPIPQATFTINVYATASLTFGAETSGHSGVVRKAAGALTIPVEYNANGNVPTSFKFRVNFDAACLAVASTPAANSSGAGWVQYDDVSTMPVLSVTALDTCPDNRTGSGMTPAMRADKALSFAIVEYKKNALNLAINASSTSTATVIDKSRRGNCNADAADGVNAADYVATVLEIFDNTALPGWLDAPMDGFDGSPFGCDSSQNGDIAANDIVCTVHESFSVTPCTAPANPINPAAAAGLDVAVASADAGAMVDVELHFDAQGAQIGALVFSLKLDPAKAAFDATDADGDGNPDAIHFNLVDGQSAVAMHDAAANKINVAVFSVTQAMQPINGNVASVSLQSVAGGDAGLVIESASASTVDGVPVPVKGTTGGQGFLPTFFNYLPMLVK